MHFYVYLATHILSNSQCYFMLYYIVFRSVCCTVESFNIIKVKVSLSSHSLHRIRKDLKMPDQR